MLIPRKIAPPLKKLNTQFPVIGILGPQKSAKKTLGKIVFSNYRYINFEELDKKRFTIEDPRKFLKFFQNEARVILDEIQRAPELLSSIQILVDQYQKPGFFILTESKNILLYQEIYQSLAGTRYRMEKVEKTSFFNFKIYGVLTDYDHFLGIFAQMVRFSCRRQGTLLS